MKRVTRRTFFSISMVLILSFFLMDAGHTQENIVVNEESGKEYTRGLELFKSGKHSQSLACFEKAYRLDERNTSALFAQGLALSKLNKYKEASGKFEMVLEKEPGHFKAVLSQAQTFIKLERYNDAVALIEKAIGVTPENASLYQMLGFIYREQDQLNKALVQFEKAIELKPADLRYQYLRTQTLADMGQMKEANKAALKILEKNKNHARARLIVADYKRKTGKIDEALVEYSLAAKNIETKAYAEYYIEAIKQELEEIEIENEYRERQKHGKRRKRLRGSISDK